MEMNVCKTVFEGRPEDFEKRLPKEQRCYDLLDGLGVAYTRVDHDFADTIEACEAVEAVLGEKICKNLFLCNRQKTQFYLLMLEGEKVFKTKDLSKQLGVARLSFADAADMERYLDITPGSVSVLGLMNDAENHVQLVIDKPVAESRMIGCIRASTRLRSPSRRTTCWTRSSRQSTMRRSWSTSRSRKKHKSNSPVCTAYGAVFAFGNVEWKISSDPTTAAAEIEGTA